MSELLNEIQRYWGQRADSFSRGVLEEDEERWMQTILAEIPLTSGRHILDIGTGPGFFAIALAKRGYCVTAVDYTPEMLEKASENAGVHREKITFLQMDAQNLVFDNNSFDGIVTRNLTWNLENPEKAYEEWQRVLKPGGVLLNFDASWYGYLYDEREPEQRPQSRKSSKEMGIRSDIYYSEAHIMENISRNLILSRCERPEADIKMLMNVGFSRISIDTDVWRRTWSLEEQRYYASTPCFMIKAQKDKIHRFPALG